MLNGNLALVAILTAFLSFGKPSTPYAQDAARGRAVASVEIGLQLIAPIEIHIDSGPDIHQKGANPGGNAGGWNVADSKSTHRWLVFSANGAAEYSFAVTVPNHERLTGGDGSTLEISGICSTRPEPVKISSHSAIRNVDAGLSWQELRFGLEADPPGFDSTVFRTVETYSAEFPVTINLE